MLIRFAQVIWAIGAFFGLLCLMFATGVNPNVQESGSTAMAVMTGLTWLAAWSFSYIVAGSFWRMPRSKP